MSELDQQSEEIKRICAEAGLSTEEMAARVGITPESMRKVAKGYQAASGPLMKSIVNAGLLEKLRKGSSRLMVLQDREMSYQDTAPGETVITFRTQDTKAAECITYVADYLNRNQHNPDRVSWFLIELKERFPMPPEVGPAPGTTKAPPIHGASSIVAEKIRALAPGAVAKARAAAREHEQKSQADEHSDGKQ